MSIAMLTLWFCSSSNFWQFLWVFFSIVSKQDVSSFVSRHFQFSPKDNRLVGLVWRGSFSFSFWPFHPSLNGSKHLEEEVETRGGTLFSSMLKDLFLLWRRNCPTRISVAVHSFIISQIRVSSPPYTRISNWVILFATPESTPGQRLCFISPDFSLSRAALHCLPSLIYNSWLPTQPLALKAFFGILIRFVVYPFDLMLVTWIANNAFFKDTV